MATSEAAIASNALQLLGLKPIINFDDGSKATNLMKALYPVTRDAVLRAFPWNCAMKYLTAPADGDAPLWDEWAYSYTLESTETTYVLRVHRVKGEENGYNWKVKGRAIYTNLAAPLIYEAIIRVKNVGLFDPLLEDAITFRLAAAAALPLTEQTKKLESMLVAYKEKIEEARTIDSQEGTPDVAEINDLITTRYGIGTTPGFRPIN